MGSAMSYTVVNQESEVVGKRHVWSSICFYSVTLKCRL